MSKNTPDIAHENKPDKGQAPNAAENGASNGDLQTTQIAQADQAKQNMLADSLAATPKAKSQHIDLHGAVEDLVKPKSEAAAPATRAGLINAQQEPMSILEQGVDSVVSLAVSNKETRRTIDHYTGEFLTAAALFAGGKAGLVGTAVLYGLNSASLTEKPSDMLVDGALGAVRGLGTRLIFAGANYLPTAPLKGVVTGIGSRVLGDVVSRDAFNDPSKIGAKIKADTFNGNAAAADAITWTLGEGLFRGSNYLSGGRLGQNPLAKGFTMGASFGAVNGTNNEIAREKADHEELSIGKIAKAGLTEAVITGAAAAGGMRVSPHPTSLHINEVKGDGKPDSKSPNLVQIGGASENGVSIAVVAGSGGSVKNVINIADIPGMPKPKALIDIPNDIYGETPGLGRPEAHPDPEPIHNPKGGGSGGAGDGRNNGGKGGAGDGSKRGGPDGPKNSAKEYIIDANGHEFSKFRNRKADGTFLKVRELIKKEDGGQELGPRKLLFVQKLGTGGEKALHAAAEKADLVVTSHPEVLTDAERSKHIFPDGEGKVWLALSGNGKRGSILRLATGDVQLNQWRKEGFVDPIRLDNGNVSLSVMAPLVVGDPHDINGEGSKGAWQELDRQLNEAKKLGVDAVSTDVWWGLIEPKKGQFDWSYYEKLSDHIKQAGLKWVPILSFHQCGGNVGDDVYQPLPEWVWGDVASRASGGNVDAVKYKSEQGHTSPEYVSLFADNAVMDNYKNVMENFQQHFAGKAADIGEVNVSLGPAGEMRYPSYNGHDNNTGYPTRGALQAYSDLAIQSFRDYVHKKYGDHSAVGKAWNIENLDDNHILPPGDAGGFFGRGDHFNTQYGRDFIDWYNQSLIDHGQRMLQTAVDVFGQKQSAFYGIDLGAKVPGVHWRIGEWRGNNINLSDRHAELAAGLIRTSRGDWDRDADGRGYRPILTMFHNLQPGTPGIGNRIVPGFTCLEMPDGDGGPSIKAMPHSLATWVGEEAERQGLWIKGENALNGNLGNNYSWDLMRGFLTLPNQHGLYHGMTFLRMSDIVNNDTARNRISQINSARVAFESIRQSIRRLFEKAA